MTRGAGRESTPEKVFSGSPRGLELFRAVQALLQAEQRNMMAVKIASEIRAISPMSAPRTPAPATIPGCGGTATWMASMMPAMGRPNLTGCTLAIFAKA